MLHCDVENGKNHNPNGLVQASQWATPRRRSYPTSSGAPLGLRRADHLCRRSGCGGTLSLPEPSGSACRSLLSSTASCRRTQQSLDLRRLRQAERSRYRYPMSSTRRAIHPITATLLRSSWSWEPASDRKRSICMCSPTPQPTTGGTSCATICDTSSIH